MGDHCSYILDHCSYILEIRTEIIQFEDVRQIEKYYKTIFILLLKM